MIPAAKVEKGGQRKPVKTKERRRVDEGELIMVVDDEADLRDMAKRIFEKRGFRVVLADTGQHAIEIFEQYAKEIRLVILDMILPGIDGTHVYDRIREISSESKIILTSGYTSNPPFQELLENNNESFIPKPWDLSKLIEEAEQILATP